MTGITQSVLGPPGGTGAAHVMQFRPVRADRVAGDFTPDARDGLGEDCEGAACRRRASKDGNRTTHDANSTHEPEHECSAFSWERPPPARRFMVRLSRDTG